MKYELIELTWITERGNIALIKRGEKNQEYAVVRNLDTEEPFESDSQWDNTIGYWSATIEGLQRAVEMFRYKSEERYISRERLIELATNFKDYVLEQLEECELEATRDMIDRYDISDYEAGFFGLETEDEDDDEDSFKGFQYNKMDDLYNGCEE